MRLSLQAMHPQASELFFSVKTIRYTETDAEKLRNPERNKVPFVLCNMKKFADPRQAGSTTTSSNLCFNQSPGSENYSESDLRQTLWYQAIIKKDIVYCDEFSPSQKKFTDKYGSGLVAPVILRGIPFNLICFGTKSTKVFSSKDRELAATFADCLAEFIRLDYVLESLAGGPKILMYEQGELSDLMKKLKLPGQKNDANGKLDH
jgi:hypothetical protein